MSNFETDFENSGNGYLEVIPYQYKPVLQAETANHAVESSSSENGRGDLGEERNERFLIFVTILPECKAQGDSCGSRGQRTARLMKVASCDLTVNDYCVNAGPDYPWRDMMKFVIENRAVMTRMYGELKESSVIEGEISTKTGRSMNIGRKVSNKGKEYIQYNRPKTSDEKKPQNTVSYTSSEKPTTVSKEPSTTFNKPAPTEAVNVTSTEMPSNREPTITEFFDEESETSDDIITIFKEDSYFIAEQQLGERDEEVDLKDLYYDTMKTITVMKEFTTVTTTPTPSTTEQVNISEATTVEPTTTEATKTSKAASTATTTDPPTTKTTTTTQAYASEEYYDAVDEVSVESFADDETWGINYQPISACQATIEYFTPYWANNTRGETLALINIHPYEQYVHSEKCVFYDGKGGKGGKSGRANADESFKFVVSVGAELTQSIYDGGSISGENILASYGCKLTIQNNSMDEIQHDTNTTTSPNPVWMSIDIKTIKEEKEESLCSVFDHFDGSNTEEINHEEQNKELGRITVKKDPGIEIEQNYTDIEASPNWLSFEIKKIKEEIEDPPSGVIDIWDGSPHGFEQENVDKGFNQETRKNVPISTFSNTSDENIGDDYLSTKRSLETQKSELTDKKANKCNFCYEYFLESSQLARHIHEHIVTTLLRIGIDSRRYTHDM
ncbi:Protein spaetzle 4 [Nymphon striatum]|nr:Protein spaetzle 4 [Nymphon striatum]